MLKAKVIANTNEITRDEWLELRKTGIGGSDASIILGKNSYQSEYSLWANKRGLTANDEAGDAAKWGNRLERTVAEAYAEETNSAVVCWPVMLQGDRSFLLANVDFFIVEPDGFAEPGKVTDLDWEPTRILAILEIKTTGISGKGNAKGWANNQVPEAYLYQGMHYALTTNIHNVVFACLVGGEGLVIREVEYTYQQLSDLQEAEAFFWHKVVNNIEPDIVGHQADFDTLKAVYPSSEGGVTIEGDEFIKDLIYEYREAKACLDKAQADVDSIRAQLLRIVGDAEAVTLDGDTLYTYKSTKDRESLDAKALKEQLPDVYAQFAKLTPGHRTLRVKGE